MNLELLESRTLLAGDTTAQEAEVDVEEQTCSWDHLKECSFPTRVAVVAANVVVAPLAFVYGVGAKAANLATGITELVLDTATCQLNPSEENCTPHRDLNPDVVTMIGGTAGAITATYFAAKKLHTMAPLDALTSSATAVVLGQATDLYTITHGGKLAIQRLAISLKEFNSYFSDEPTTPINT